MRVLKISLIGSACSFAFFSAALAETKLTVGVALPRAQLGQPNGASADVARTRTTGAHEFV